MKISRLLLIVVLVSSLGTGLFLYLKQDTPYESPIQTSSGTTKEEVHRTGSIGAFAFDSASDGRNVYGQQSGIPDLYLWSGTSLSNDPFSSRTRSLMDEITRFLLDSNPSKDISILDKLTTELLFDPTIPRTEKMRALWEIIQEFGMDNEIGQYMLDALSMLHPFELFPEILASSSNVSSKTQSHITRLLMSSFLVDYGQLDGNSLKLHYLDERRQDVESYFAYQMTHADSRDMIYALLQSLPVVSLYGGALPENAMEMLESNKTLFTPEEYYVEKYKLLSFLSQLDKPDAITTFLDEVKTASDPVVMHAIADQIYLQVEQNTDMFLSAQPEAWKEFARDIVATQKPEKLNENTDINTWAFDYGKWAVASTALDTSGLTYPERLRSFLDTIDPVRQGAVLSVLALTQNSSPSPDPQIANIIQNYTSNIQSQISTLSPEDQSLVDMVLPNLGL